MKCFKLISWFLLLGTPIWVSASEVEKYNIALDNSSLTAAVQAFKDNSNDATREKLMESLTNASYLIASNPSRQITEPDSQGYVFKDVDSEWDLLSIEDESGKSLLPIFSNWNELKQFFDFPVTGVVVKGKNVWELVLRSNDYEAILVDPISTSIELNRETLEYMSK
ncbi:SseB family protein [Vibrio tubiashii]|uniref:SseB protein N-terminal domain-containing protein n=1 Tax=Vibrio tubiashii ATCC 19109 TaxID=1051646 RepID=F9TDS8_9VIBR|nr:SseB family protein [Vibrio tubiashii]AIW14114.1 hypothetical protein IX91_07870 [Vibrio tubiashii ATCC 19109]EGU46660.1 hypothetical protein VITU9109_04762 [Vibrio tubiashii ATCC 19109]EIF02934.1 hypothetical protein VT1337_16444 [Vibrio tubiashii NCIMB 1337 = ATCC 19106]